MRQRRRLTAGIHTRSSGTRGAQASGRPFACVPLPDTFDPCLMRMQVGINYTGQKNELQGCVNDARNMYQFLMGLHRVHLIPWSWHNWWVEKHRYSHSNIIVLTDDNTNPRNQPTRKNMLNAMRWLVEDACPDDALFIHCECTEVPKRHSMTVRRRFWTWR